MKVLLLALSIVFVLHCTTAEENTEAELAERTFAETGDNLLTDLEDALNIQARDEPDGNDKIEAYGSKSVEDENQVKDLAMEVRDLLKQDGEADIPDGEDTDVVESLKRKLEDTAAGDGDDGEGPADEDGTEESLDTETRAISCRRRNWSCSSRYRCCYGLSCRRLYSYGRYRYRCGSSIGSSSCRRRNQTCYYGSRTYRCCSGLYCYRTRRRVCYWARVGSRYVRRCRYRYTSSRGTCRSRYRG